MTNISKEGPQEQSLHPDEDGLVLLGEVANEIGMQTQYASYYLSGIANYPHVGEGLHFVEGHTGNYHATKMPVADAEEFIRRMKDRRKEV